MATKSEGTIIKSTINEDVSLSFHLFTFFVFAHTYTNAENKMQILDEVTLKPI